ncbi:MAG: GNAT family N-acetyltransferase [Clostridia bacterium]|nr:GNAT family N-acetyltransferase [Clostridia bacterium]
MEIREYTAYHDEEIAKLYASVGWIAYTNDLPALRRGFENSLLVLAAYEDGRLIGIVRCVGDGETIVWIQDVLVHPAYRRRGVGRALILAVLERYPKVRQIELATDDTPETTAFYKSLGFRAFSEIGCSGFMRI